MHPFTCPQCGYRNFITQEDLEAERVKIAGRVARRKARFTQESELGKPMRPFASTFSALNAIRQMFKR